MKQERKTQSMTGAVLVLGGGPAGIQASLDLGDSGFRVYLADRSSSIGGNMARLDKVFPTNECAMCILGPRMSAAAGHPNIQIITGAELESLHGEAGNFDATLRVAPRYVDLEKCNACGDCVEACPVGLRSDFNVGLGSRKAIDRFFPQAVPNAMAIVKRGPSPCRLACPAETNAQAYVALIAQERFEEAFQVAARNNPFLGVCGRICHHPCEKQCERGRVDDPLSICRLKRFLADYARERGIRIDAGERVEQESQRVAVVGSGPTGLSTAYYLARRGYPVVIFERFPVAGGMLRTAIPTFRLPEDVLKYEVDNIVSLGVDIRTGCELGRDFSLDDLFGQGFQVVFLATGARASKPLRIPGEDLEGVLPILAFLEAVRMGKKVSIGRRVAVIGGGNAGIDAARTALRLGACEVHILEMSAVAGEAHEAEREGACLRLLTMPVRILGSAGRVRGVECMRTKVHGTDEEGRPKLMAIEGSNFTLEADTVIAAIGQTSHIPDLGLATDDAGFLKVSDTSMTSREGVFAGGDVVRGPASVIEAIADGRQAAGTIDEVLSGKSPSVLVRDTREPVHWPDEYIENLEKQPRLEAPSLPVEERITSLHLEVDGVYDKETAAAEAARCLNCGGCCECESCVAACKPEAIDHDEKEREIQLSVGSVIAATGFRQIDASKRGEYGFGRYSNVVTSMQFERLLSAAGPTGGHVLRPSDGEVPKRIAWIQCVGSREKEDLEARHCSAICCMQATKHALITKEHHPEIETTIFHNDVRASGKGFEQYCVSARDAHGVRYIRGLPSSVHEIKKSNVLSLKYWQDDEGLKKEGFDLVVLSAGLRPADGTRELADAVGFELAENAYPAFNGLLPGKTSRPGVFVCGAAMGPVDIPGAVVQGGGAAADAAALLAPARHTQVTIKEYPPEQDTSDAPPRVGVFVCRCGSNIAGVLDVEGLAEAASRLPSVVHAQELLYTCSRDGLTQIQNAIRDQGVNRVVVASCTPRSHEEIFRETAREAGLNRFLVEMANIREHCAWVHRGIPEEATGKASGLIARAVAKAALNRAVHLQKESVESRALVIGGGLAGLIAADNLAGQGIPVELVELGAELGGILREIHEVQEPADTKEFLRSLVDRVKGHPLIQVYTQARVESHAGHGGQFASRIVSAQTGDLLAEIKHGATIVAVGAKEYGPKEFEYGTDDRILTQLQFEQMLSGKSDLCRSLKSIVMIQCVGSRNEEHPYCSRVCCLSAVRNALALKRLNPDAQIRVLYRDMRTEGLYEEAYLSARDAGVQFDLYDEKNQPRIEKGENIRVGWVSPGTAEKKELSADLVILSAGIVPADGAEEIATLLRVPLNEDRFFLEAHMKLRPVEFAFDGIFVCGTAHAPKTVPETIAQARAAASRAAALLVHETRQVGGAVAKVDAERCIACLTCLRVCPYGAPSINDEGVAEIDAASCQGCGTCVAECPARAIALEHWRDEQMESEIAALLAHEVLV